MPKAGWTIPPTRHHPHQDHVARRDELLRWLTTTSAEEIAKALGISDRHARRLRTGDIDQLALKGAKPAEPKT
jgi:predicted ArsR family transcriptional regulator